MTATELESTKTCPICGGHKFLLLEDQGNDPEWPVCCGYDVYCSLCDAELGHIYFDDLQTLDELLERL